MKLSLVSLSLFLLAASAAAVPVPVPDPDAQTDLAARDNHSPAAPPENHGTRASISVSIPELEAQIQQAEHDRQVLLSMGEYGAAERKAHVIQQLRAQVEAYQDAEKNNGAIWDMLGKRQAGVDDVTRRIILLEKQRRQLIILGRTAEAEAKAREIAQLKLRQNPDAAKEEARGKRAGITISFSEQEARIRQLESEIRTLQQLGEVEAARRRMRELAQLKSEADRYADAERNSANRFGGRGLAERDAERDAEPELDPRGSVKVNIGELKAKIRKAQQDYNTLRSMGEHAAAKRKLKYLNGLKAKLRAYEDADSSAGAGFKRSVGEFDYVDVARMG